MIFLDPYDVGVLVSGVIKGLEPVRPNWLQDAFGAPQFSEKTRINLDLEFNVKNVMGTFVSPKADVTPIKLPDFGTEELYFSYSKESVDSDDFDVLNTRQIGEQPGNANILATQASRLLRKMILAEQRFENLFELCASQILMYGGYQAEGERHPTIRYDFSRTVISNFADLLNLPLIPSVNLTTTAVTAPWDSSITILPVLATGNGVTQGDRAWTIANIDAGKATPVKDIVKMYETAAARSGTKDVFMSDDAYAAFSYDLKKNYDEAANALIAALLKTSQDLLPRAQNYKGLTFKRTYAIDDHGNSVNMYSYNASYNDRITGAEKKFIGNGWVIFIPPATSGLKVYGRIMHKKANWAAMSRWVNYWEDQKSGEQMWEYHTNFLMAHTDINAVVSWKVL